MTQECLICKVKFESSKSQKTCSDQCRILHRKNRRKKSDENVTVTRTCKFCGESFKARRYKPKAFCNRSCASKYYIQNGTYDKWRLRANERQGFYKPCFVCGTMIYLEPRFKGIDGLVKVCGIDCEKKHFSKLFENGGPMSGKHLTQEQKTKQRETMRTKYGVENAYMLAKRSVISKPQRELYDILNKYYDCKLEVLLPFHTLRYFADIFIPDLQVIVEFMGNYWHCNPATYEENYWHKKKGLFAKQIWEADKERKEILETFGYNVFPIWESDYTKDKDQVITLLKEKIDDCRCKSTNSTTKET